MTKPVFSKQKLGGEKRVCVDIHVQSCWLYSRQVKPVKTSTSQIKYLATGCWLFLGHLHILCMETRQCHSNKTSSWWPFCHARLTSAPFRRDQATQ